jgi:hypothetical protein
LGVLHLDLPKLFGLLAARWKKRASRATLHAPDVKLCRLGRFSRV